MDMVEVNPIRLWNTAVAINRSPWLQRFVGVWIALGLVFCPSCGPRNMQLRIRNEGSKAIQQLTVRFPEDEVEFGDVGPGAFSSYREVPHGVGPYASFRFVFNGVPIEQYVADFVGWKPVKGVAFTYRVRVEPGRLQPFLNIVAVVKDR
jgi:hypothetical protein